MERGKWWSPAPLEAHKSSLSWEAKEGSASPRACRATSLAGKNLKGKKVSVKGHIHYRVNLYNILCSVFVGTDR